MELSFIDTENWEERTVRDKSECRTDTEILLWEMHERYPDQVWKCGKIHAVNMELTTPISTVDRWINS